MEAKYNASRIFPFLSQVDLVILSRASKTLRAHVLEYARAIKCPNRERKQWIRLCAADNHVLCIRGKRHAYDIMKAAIIKGHFNITAAFDASKIDPSKYNNLYIHAAVLGNQGVASKLYFLVGEVIRLKARLIGDINPSNVNTIIKSGYSYEYDVAKYAMFRDQRDILGYIAKSYHSLHGYVMYCAAKYNKISLIPIIWVNCIHAHAVRLAAKFNNAAFLESLFNLYSETKLSKSIEHGTIRRGLNIALRCRSYEAAIVIAKWTVNLGKKLEKKIVRGYRNHLFWVKKRTMDLFEQIGVNIELLFETARNAGQHALVVQLMKYADLRHLLKKYDLDTVKLFIRSGQTWALEHAIVADLNDRSAVQNDLNDRSAPQNDLNDRSAPQNDLDCYFIIVCADGTAAQIEICLRFGAVVTELCLKMLKNRLDYSGRIAKMISRALEKQK